MTAKEILVKARELISKPGSWCQGAMARDKYGIQISMIDMMEKTPHAYCAIGALYKASGSYTNSAGSTARTKLRDVILGTDYGGIPDFNDKEGTTHAQVLEMFDKAIAQIKDGVP